MQAERVTHVSAYIIIISIQTSTCTFIITVHAEKIIYHNIYRKKESPLHGKGTSYKNRLSDRLVPY